MVRENKEERRRGTHLSVEPPRKSLPRCGVSSPRRAPPCVLGRLHMRCPGQRRMGEPEHAVLPPPLAHSATDAGHARCRQHRSVMPQGEP